MSKQTSLQKILMMQIKWFAIADECMIFSTDYIAELEIATCDEIFACSSSSLYCYRSW